MNSGCPISSLPFLRFPVGILVFRITHQCRFMGLMCEPPYLVLALQIHEPNGRSDTIGEVVAEAAEQLVGVPEGILDHQAFD
jgi:hypothetical protein